MSAPWLTRKEWSSPTIYPNAQSGRLLMWVLGGIFGGFSGLMLVVGYEDLSRLLAMLTGWSCRGLHGSDCRF